MKSYTDLDIWQLSRGLVKTIYKLTATFPIDEKYGLSSQMRRAAVSIPSNIAEGHGRNHIKESIQFFFISRGSLYELETQLYLAYDLEYCTEQNLSQYLNTIIQCKQMLNGLIRYFENRASNIEPRTSQS